MRIENCHTDYTILACLDTTLRTVQGHFPNLWLDILSLLERVPQLLANSAVDWVIAGQSIDVGIPPNDCLYKNQFVCIACPKWARLGMSCRPKISQNATMRSSGILSIK